MLIANQLSYLGPLIYYLTMLLTQLSILAFYYKRLNFSKRGQIITYVILAFATLNTCTSVIVNFILNDKDHGLAILWYTYCGISLPIDFGIWFLPIPLVFRLQNLDRRKKIGLVLTFSVGFMCPVCALARFFFVKQAAKMQGDLAWNKVFIQVLTTAEAGIGICAVSMACLRPLLVQFLNWCSGTLHSGSVPTVMTTRMHVAQVRRSEADSGTNVWPGDSGSEGSERGVLSKDSTRVKNSHVWDTGSEHEVGNF